MSKTFTFEHLRLKTMSIKLIMKFSKINFSVLYYLFSDPDVQFNSIGERSDPMFIFRNLREFSEGLM